MNYRKASILILLIAIFLHSCAGNQELVAQKQARIDSLVVLTNDLHKDLDRNVAALNQIKDESANQDAELQDALSKLSKIQDVTVENNRTVITYDLLFQSGSFQITRKGQKILNDVWEVLQNHPSRQILIVGHTDNLPIGKDFVAAYKSNWDLSTWRALAVLHHIEGLPNANPNRLAVVGYGSNQPIADNSTDEGKRQNRRVEIILGEDLNDMN